MATSIKVIPIKPIKAWEMIHMKELYKSTHEIDPPDTANLERRIPRVGWWVCEESSFYIVTRVLEDNTSVLMRITPGQGEQYSNIITGPAVHQYTSPFRLMVDPDSTPVRFRVDDAMLFHGSEPMYYKVFFGSDVTVKGRVISTAVNGNGVPTDANLLLEIIKQPNNVNDVVKVARGGHLVEIPANQEMVTVVAYRADGLQVAVREAVVCYTTNITPLDLPKRMIVDVALETPFLNKDDRKLIEIPVNMLVQSTAIMGVVTYNNGEIKRLPINGDKFTLDGLLDFSSTVAGSMYDLGLTYILSDNEEAWDALGNTPIRVKTEKYKVRAINPDGDYTAKLFVVPAWSSVKAEYELKWYLYNMARKYLYDVTNLTTFTPGFNFNGKLYNVPQKLRVAINMGDVDAYFINYRHVQDLEVTLMATGIAHSQNTYYRIAYDDQYTYGNGIRADVTANPQQIGTFNINISNGCTTVDEWLAKHYHPTEPLYFTSGEDLPPNPTDVTIRDGANTWRRVVPITDVLQSVTGITSPIKQGDTIILEFSAKTSTDKLELSLGSLVANLYQ